MSGSVACLDLASVQGQSRGQLRGSRNMRRGVAVLPLCLFPQMGLFSDEMEKGEKGKAPEEDVRPSQG